MPNNGYDQELYMTLSEGNNNLFGMLCAMQRNKIPFSLSREKKGINRILKNVDIELTITKENLPMIISILNQIADMDGISIELGFKSDKLDSILKIRSRLLNSNDFYQKVTEATEKRMNISECSELVRSIIRAHEILRAYIPTQYRSGGNISIINNWITRNLSFGFDPSNDDSVIGDVLEKMHMYKKVNYPGKGINYYRTEIRRRPKTKIEELDFLLLYHFIKDGRSIIQDDEFFDTLSDHNWDTDFSNVVDIVSKDILLQECDIIGLAKTILEEKNEIEWKNFFIGNTPCNRNSAQLSISKENIISIVNVFFETIEIENLNKEAFESQKESGTLEDIYGIIDEAIYRLCYRNGKTLTNNMFLAIVQSSVRELLNRYLLSRFPQNNILLDEINNMRIRTFVDGYNSANKLVSDSSNNLIYDASNMLGAICALKFGEKGLTRKNKNNLKSLIDSMNRKRNFGVVNYILDGVLLNQGNSKQNERKKIAKDFYRRRNEYIA